MIGHAVGRGKDIVAGEHQYPGFDLGFDRQRNMNGHLVAVEISVEGRADQRVQPDGLALDQNRFKGLDAQPMKGGRPVQQNRIFLDHFVQGIPDFRNFAFHHLFGAFDGGYQSFLLQAIVDKGFEQAPAPFSWAGRIDAAAGSGRW